MCVYDVVKLILQVDSAEKHAQTRQATNPESLKHLPAPSPGEGQDKALAGAQGAPGEFVLRMVELLIWDGLKGIQKENRNPSWGCGQCTHFALIRKSVLPHDGQMRRQSQ